MQATVLAYHSHRVLGADYATNDHVALAADLELLNRLGVEIVPLAAVVAFARTGRVAGSHSIAAITFDDGPAYDVADFDHPSFGAQRSFLGILRDFEAAAASQRSVHATSFVIASAQARRAMECTFDARYTFLGADSMGDDWWSEAIASGRIEIANHSFDHLHPALEQVAHSRQARGDFTAVDNERDADAQIARAQALIAQRTGGRNAPYFAYPFGHCNAYLSREYLPRPSSGIVAAFTTEPRHVRARDWPWALPRFVCGEHWRSPRELESLLGCASR